MTKRKITKNSKRRKLRIDSIRLDFQAPDHLMEEQIQEYVDAIKGGGVLEPVVVRFDGKNYFLQDGFHRLEALRRCFQITIYAEVSPGSLAEMEAEFRRMLEEVKRSLRP
jgi:hypothetical protein